MIRQVEAEALPFVLRPISQNQLDRVEDGEPAFDAGIEIQPQTLFQQ